MKTYSNEKPPSTPLKWLDGEWALFANIKENTVTSEEDEGRRWEADLTVVRDLTAESAIQAFTRLQQDPELDYKVYTSDKVDGVYAIDVKKDYPLKASSTIFPPLPASGELKRGQIYSYNNGAVMVVQDHYRSIYTPEETPALFSFYREVKEGQAWVPNEDVALNETRTFEGKVYKCIQAHKTLEGWTPLATPALWQEVAVTPETPVWVQPSGAHDAYNKGDRVHFPTINDPVYESVINANVWAPLSIGAENLWKRV